MPDRCDCMCHAEPGIVHIDACCFQCSTCHESRILDIPTHRCGPIHLGQGTEEGIKLVCLDVSPFAVWVSGKDLPRKISIIPQEDAAWLRFSKKLDKVTCLDCLKGANGSPNAHS